MDSSSSFPKIEQLSEDNFYTWKQKVQLLLCYREVDFTLTQDAPEKNHDEYDKWLKANNKAKAIIGLSLSNEHLHHVADADSAKKMWEALLDIYEKNTLLNKLTARRRFYTAEMEADETVLTFSNRIKQYAVVLDGMGLKVDGKEKAMAMLNGLPTTYSGIISALDALGNEDDHFTLEYVTSRLIQEEQRLNARTKHVSNRSSALFAKLGPRKQRCGHCNKIGHPMERCYKKFPNLAPKNWNHDNKKESAHLHSKTLEPANINDIEEEVAMYTITAAASSIETTNPSRWILDTACTSHMTHDRSSFVTFEETSCIIHMGSDAKALATGIGTVQVRIKKGKDTCRLILQDVLYIPNFRCQLISVSKMSENGANSTFTHNVCTIRRNGRIVASGRLEDGLYYLDTLMKRKVNYSLDQRAHLSTLSTWHERLGHVSNETIKRMAINNVVDGLSVSRSNDTLDICSGCAQGKAHSHPFKSSVRKTTRRLELVHSDVLGPIDPVSLGGARYIVTFIDDYSRWATAFPMRNKSEVFEFFKSFKTYSENNTGRKLGSLTSVTKHPETLVTLRSDNGGEYLSLEFRRYLKNNGIKHELTVPGTPQQNGVAERFNRTLLELMRSVIAHRSLDKRLWGELVAAIVFIRNRVTSNSLPIHKTPYHLWHNKKPDVSHLRALGCECWYKITVNSKLQSRASKGLLVGYSENRKAYRIWIPNTHTVVNSRNVQFNENCSKSIQEKKENSTLPNLDLDEHDPSTFENTVCDTSINGNASSHVGGVLDDQPNDADESPEMRDQPRRSSRQRKMPERFVPGQSAYVMEADCNTPTSFKQSQLPEYRSVWQEAIDKEHDCLIKNNTWTFVQRPNNVDVLPCMYIFKMKTNGPKARLVALGSRQVEGIHYGEVYAPVVKLQTMRLLLGKVATNNMELQQMDVVTAFLHGEIDTEVYMTVPEGMKSMAPPNSVCKLNKALYGLRQAPKLWYLKLHNYLVKDMNFACSPNDPCLYTSLNDPDSTTITVYVDDLLIASNSKEGLNRTKKLLSNKFDMKDLGEASSCLGLDIRRNRKEGTLNLSQTIYGKRVLDRFGMKDSKGCNTPMCAKSIDTVRDESSPLKNTTAYKQAIGSLMYLATCTRPDLAQSVGYLSRFQSEPHELHWNGIKRVLRYLKSTLSLGITYGIAANSPIIGYCDSDWAGCTNTRRSTSGYIFTFAGGAVSWASKRQTMVATSTCEAEYVSACAGTQEALWLRRICKDLNLINDRPLPIYVDNQGAIDSTRNKSINARNKHIEVKFHFIRDAVENKLVTVNYIPTHDMVADPLTKPVDKTILEKLRLKMGMCETP